MNDSKKGGVTLNIGLSHTDLRHSFFDNNQVMVRDGDYIITLANKEDLQTLDGAFLARMDGYTIMPNEEYEKLQKRIEELEAMLEKTAPYSSYALKK